jgi:hypothetical protein
MSKIIDPLEIRDISYNYETRRMEIFNKKNLLLFNSVVSVSTFVKSVCKWTESVNEK